MVKETLSLSQVSSSLTENFSFTLKMVTERISRLGDTRQTECRNNVLKRHAGQNSEDLRKHKETDIQK